MLRITATKDDKIDRIISEFPNEFSKTSLKKLFCNFCRTTVNFYSIDRVKSHRKSSTHNESLAEENLNKGSNSRPKKKSPSLIQMRKKDTSFRLCDVFISTNIPLHKNRRPKWQAFYKGFLGASISDLIYEGKLN